MIKYLTYYTISGNLKKGYKMAPCASGNYHKPVILSAAKNLTYKTLRCAQGDRRCVKKEADTR